MQKKDDCIMYCRSWCGDCRRAIHWLDARGIEYKLVDIEQVPGSADRVRELAGKIVTPTFEVGGEIVISFDEQRLSELLK
jgi:glutaredoxin